jgi:hypothetical protein
MSQFKKLSGLEIKDSFEARGFLAELSLMLSFQDGWRRFMLLFPATSEGSILLSALISA